jgi:hypothetical protein
LARSSWHIIVQAKNQIELSGKDFSYNPIFKEINSLEETYLTYMV